VIGLAVLDILYPLLNKYAIEEFFTKQNFTNIKLFIGAYCLIAIGYGVVVHGFIKMAGLVEVEVGYELRHEAFVKLQLLPFSYYDKTPAGWIMARLTSDSRRLAGIISWGIVDMLWGSLTMVGILVLMYFVNWKLALIITFLLPILVVVSIYFRKKILISYRGVRKTNSKITASYNEGILGSKTTKTLVLEEDRNREFNELCNKMRKDSIKAIAYSSLFFPILLVISYIAVAITLRAGGYLIIVEGVIGISTLYFFISCTTQFFDPIMQIARILAEFQQAQASAERILSLIETKPDIFDSQEVEEKYGTLLEPKTENWEELKGKVVFEQVTFQYQGGEKVLEDFNLTVPEGTSVALVGETGAGKSTIVNLVCRFYEPTAGKILIDDVDYKERSLAWLHNN
jgi:ATP-binding cassette subfamily B protein